MHLYQAFHATRGSPLQQSSQANLAEVASPKSGESEDLLAASRLMSPVPISDVEGEDENSKGRDKQPQEETWARASSSGTIGSAFFITRRPDRDDIISPQLRQTVFQLFQKSTLEPGGTLDRRCFEVFEALQGASASSVWYTR
jgi:hypothetical protein